MNKIKLVLQYTSIFIMSMVILVFTILGVLKFTLLNRNYVENKFTDKYYDKIYESLKKEMKDSMISSGIDDKVVDDIYTKEDLKNTISDVLDIVYSDNTKKIDTSKIESKLKDNINKNLEEKGITNTDNEAFNSFVNSLIDIYTREFNMLGMVSKLGKVVVMASKITNIAFITLLIVILIYIVIVRKNLGKYLSIPLFTSSMLTMLGSVYINKRIDISHFTILSNAFTSFIRKLLLSTFNTYLIIGVIYLLVGIILIILTTKKVNK